MPLCVKVAGFHAEVRWQASQACVVCTWLVGLPVALLPLWQVAHEPGAIPVWVKFAGFHAEVRWQASQDCVVATCLVDLPVALLPL